MTKKGFSLVELMVTVAIMAIIASGAMGSFYILGDILRVKQGAGLIQDMIQQADQLALRGEYKKITIHFERDYLVMEYEPEVMGIDFQLNGNNLTVTTGSDLILHKQDPSGKILDTRSVIGPTTIDPFNPPDDPVTDFRKALEEGWNYQLKNSSDVSCIIGFRHFNINRDSKSVQNNPLLLEGINNTRLVIASPSHYIVKHTLYDANQLQSVLTLTLRDEKNRKSENFEVR